MKNKHQGKASGLNRLPSYIFRLIIMSAVLAGIFFIFIYQQWKYINNNEELLTQVHLPLVSMSFQLQSELSDLGSRLPKDISSLYMAQMLNEYKVDLSTQTQFSYKRKIISDLLVRIAALQKNKNAPLYIVPFNRLEHIVNILLETLKYNETALRLESAAFNVDLNQAKVAVEQYRRLHEREAKHVGTVVDIAYHNLIWSTSILGVILLLLWSVLLVRSSAIIGKAIIKQQKSEEQVTESQQLLEAILNHASASVYLKDLDGRYLFINHQFEMLFNVTNKEFMGKTDYSIHLPKVADKLQANDWEVLATLQHIDYEEEVEHLDGLHTYMSTKFPIFDQQGKVYALCGMSTDISMRKEIELNLRKLNLAVEQSPNLVVITNIRGVIEYVNHKVTELTGYLPEEVIGQLSSIFNSDKTPDSIYTELWNTITSGKVWRGILQNKKKNGDIYWAQESIAPVKNDAQEITHYVSIQEDVTSARELTDKLSYQADHDPLTGLINRQAFERRLERVLQTAKENDSEHALCYLDLDQFKIVNDSCSHAAGDELLRQLSKELSKTIRHRDTLGRLGGDEFAVLMEHCSLQQAKRTAEKILTRVSQFHFGWENKSFRIGVSIGLVPVSSQSGSIGDLLKQADIACYAAKDAGRNRIHVFLQDDKFMQHHHGEMDWVSKINHALENSLFILYAQSINALRPGLDPHYEILIRMLGDDGQIIAPGAFLPAAERYHLSKKIDQWVIHNTFVWIKENPDKYQENTVFSINLSGQNLGDKLLLEFIYNEFSITCINFKNICFEITETAAILNLSTASDFILSLKNAGCKFAIDDFGSGLSSFDYLKRLPVDYLKIDGIFVKDIIEDPVDLALVKSINEIGHVMGKQTIAEFVENQQILDELKKIGVDFAQGYHLDKPKPLSELRM
jgi:diguanylate cyclase (GGDEF)-like protein/PAS domain S-box-containing protein